MTPNFALSLSFDGIRLLQRAPDGWTLVGEVSLDAQNLSAALADLRAKALRLAPEGLRTKLVIPPDQIRFMTLESAQTSLADVRQALEGQTPYALDELVIDFDRHGGRTHIAAVARETLAEAEAFAVEHSFAPVAFVAVPEPDTFAGEVFFGPARAAGRTEVSRDSRPVVQTGVVDLPASDAPAAPEVDTAMPPPQTDVSAGSVPKAGAEPVFASRARPAGRSDAESEPESDQSAAHRDAGTPGGRGAPQPAPMRPPVQAPVQTPVQAPIQVKAPASSAARAGAGSSAQPQAPAKPQAAAKRRGAVLAAPRAAPVEPLFTRRKEPPPPAPAKAAAAPADGQQAEVRPAAAASTPTLAPKLATALTPTMAPPIAPAAPQRDTAPKSRLGPAPPRGKPRFLGLILTAILLLLLLVVGLWASTLPPDGIAGWFRGSDDAIQTAAAETADGIAATGDMGPVAADSAAGELSEPAPDDEIAAMPQVTAEPGQPVVRAPAGRVLSPAEADRIYAATGVYQRAPRLTLTPRTSTLDGLEPVSLIPTPAELPRPAMPVLDVATPDAALATPVNPPRADAVFERDENGNILASPDGTLMPDGALVIAGAPEMRPVPRPRSTRPVGPEAVDAPAPPTVLPRPRPADLAPATPPVTPDPETVQSGDQTGDQTEGQTDGIALPPDAVKVTTGPPPLRPKQRPLAFADLAPPATVDDPAPAGGALAFDGIRPTARPQAIAAAAPLPSYTGLRPVTRPDGLAPEAVAAAEMSSEPEPEPEAAPVADINAVAAAIAMAAPPSAFANRTQLAVSVTPRPDSRPRNFAQVVASARATPAPAAPRNSAAAPAAAVATPAPPTLVAPSGPVPGGVARAATQEDAINLRQMNLVGVYGKPNQRRALVRLGNGRYVKVEVGSSLDGGQVTAIGDSALNFVKRGRTYALVLPAG